MVSDAALIPGHMLELRNLVFDSIRATHFNSSHIVFEENFKLSLSYPCSVKLSALLLPFWSAEYFPLQLTLNITPTLNAHICFPKFFFEGITFNHSLLSVSLDELSLQEVSSVSITPEYPIQYRLMNYTFWLSVVIFVKKYLKYLFNLTSAVVVLFLGFLCSFFNIWQDWVDPFLTYSFVVFLSDVLSLVVRLACLFQVNFIPIIERFVQLEPLFYDPSKHILVKDATIPIQYFNQTRLVESGAVSA